jgi:hypothetical protein
MNDDVLPVKTKTLTVERVAKVLSRYLQRPKNNVGGSLHIITDDGNYALRSAQFCELYATEIGDWSGARLARLLMLCSRTQRIKACRMATR